MNGKLWHKCILCCHDWESVDENTAEHIRTAAKVNRDGPYCDLCMHLEMAYRYSRDRRMSLAVSAQRFIYNRLNKKAPSDELGAQDDKTTVKQPN